MKTEKNSIELESLFLIFNSILKKEIELPNENYLWEVKNASKGEINNNGLFTAKTEIGTTSLTVSDIRKTYSFFLFIFIRNF